MTLRTGTHDITTLLAVQGQSVVDYGLDRANVAIQAELAAHNAIVDDMIGLLAERTTDRGAVYGAGAQMEMIDADEYTRAPTQVPGVPSMIDFPLKKKAIAIGWTNDWFQQNTPADLARAMLDAEEADLRAIQLEIKRAIYGATNYSIRDTTVDNYTLNVKRFVNADSAAVPVGPNGETFNGATHTHYDGVAALSNAALLGEVNDVTEHGHTRDVRIAINTADEASVRALADFRPFYDPEIRPSANVDIATRPLDMDNAGNRAIGRFNGATVWVKPWALASYPFVWAAGDPRKPLRFREPVQANLRGFRIVGENPAFPLLARFMERRFGVGVWTRTNGAVLYTANATYASPTL